GLGKFVLGDAILKDLRHLGVDRLLDVLDRRIAAWRAVDRKGRVVERGALIVGTRTRGQTVLHHDFLIDAAAHAPAKNFAKDLKRFCLAILRRGVGRDNPALRIGWDTDTGIIHRDHATRVLFRLNRAHTRRQIRTTFYSAIGFLGQRTNGRLVHIAGDNQYGIIGSIELLIELDRIGAIQLLNFLHPPDYRDPVG